MERPFRFGPRFRAAKTVFLASLLAIAAGAGLFVYSRAGLPERLSQAPDYTTTATWDDACQVYTGIGKSTDPGYDYYCRFSGGHGPATVAVIGNSHALSAYFGLEKYNSRVGLNTMLLGVNGQLLLRGADLNLKWFRAFEILLNHPEIKYVFIVNRAGCDWQAPDYLQLSIDKLNAAGKKVFMVVDWPRLLRKGVDYLIRPYSEFVKPADIAERRKELDRNTLEAIELDKGMKFSRQDYLQLMRSLKNVTLIEETWDAFCPGRECLVFSEAGKLLYSDGDHLTEAGSEFLAGKVLKPYLDKLNPEPSLSYQ